MLKYCSPAKPSRPSRAYLHLVRQEYVAMLSDLVRHTIFNDARASAKDSALLGPPSVEFAPYGRAPNSRLRKDARQGTIDQDPEFIDFLESLTNPITKSIPVDQENDAAGKSKEKITVTPLVQFLKDKKANKGKENAGPTKGGKQLRQESKEAKSSNVSETKANTGSSTVSSPKKRSAQAVKVEQAARDAVKVLNKQATNTNKGVTSPTSAAAGPPAKSPNMVSNTTANSALADKKRERGNASAAAKILQRDLGLVGNPSGRGGRRGPLGNSTRANVASSNPASKQDTGTSQAASSSASSSTNTAIAPSSGIIVPGSTTAAKPPNSQPPSGPAASRPTVKATTTFVGDSSTKAASSPAKTSNPPSTATQAFLKHANPSQGITEPLLEEAFLAFGKIDKVEIDKKKGFAYVDFAEPEGLQKAIKASPIKVAQGQVVVLERKSGSNLQARNIRGSGAIVGNRGGAMPMGGRGGSMRGRGGFGRGGIGMPNTNNNRPIPPAANIHTKPSPSATQNTTTATSANEESAPKSEPAPTKATPTAPAD